MADWRSQMNLVRAVALLFAVPGLGDGLSDTFRVGAHVRFEIVARGGSTGCTVDVRLSAYDSDRKTFTRITETACPGKDPQTQVQSISPAEGTSYTPARIA